MAIDAWEPAHTRDLEATTAAKIRHLLRPVRDRLGDRRFQTLTRADIDALADWMLKAGRRRVGKPGTPLSARTVRDTLAVFQQACDDAVDERVIAANPCRRVKRPKSAPAEHELWSDDEAARFEAAAERDRLSPVITLQCLGLRPEEACALRWRRDVNLTAGTLTVRQARTLADGRPVEKAQRQAGKRTLPLDDALVKVLRTFRAVQAAKRLAAGEAYDPSGDYVCCDELGAPYDPAKPPGVVPRDEARPASPRSRRTQRAVTLRAVTWAELVFRPRSLLLGSGTPMRVHDAGLRARRPGGILPQRVTHWRPGRSRRSEDCAISVQSRPVERAATTWKQLNQASDLGRGGGFELPASSSRTKRAAKLRHTPLTAREV